MLIVYNGEAHLARALDAILAQGFTDFEVIAVNDGSTDRTAEILLRYTDKDKRVKVFTNERNSGLTFTRNVALSQCHGKYIVVNDSDDVSLPGRFQTQFEYMERHPDVVVCGTWAYRIYPGGTKVEWRFPVSDEANRVRMLEGCPNLNSTVIIRNEAIKRQGLKFRNGYASSEDFKLFSELSFGGKIINLPLFFVDYYMHEQQQTKLQKPDMIRDAAKVPLELLKDTGMDVQFGGTEQNAFTKAFAFSYPMQTDEISFLIHLYQRIVAHNEQCGFFDQALLHQFLGKKLYEVCFHSTKLNGLASQYLYRSAGFIKVNDSYRDKFKLFVKALLRL